MINCFNNVCSSFQEWRQEITDQASEWLDHNWEYYTKERAIFKGLPFAAISTLACTLLFNCTKPAIGTIFGVVNYIILTSSLEIIRKHHEIDKIKALAILGMSGAISLAFIRTVCKTSMSYQAAILLATAAFAGQLAREYFSTQEY